MDGPPPRTILACVGFHLLIGANGLAFATWVARRRRATEAHAPGQSLGRPSDPSAAPDPIAP